MGETIGAHDTPRAEGVFGAVDIAHAPPRLLHQDCPPRDVPGVQVRLKVAGQPPARNPREHHRGRAQHADGPHRECRHCSQPAQHGAGGASCAEPRAHGRIAHLRLLAHPNGLAVEECTSTQGRRKALVAEWIQNDTSNDLAFVCHTDRNSRKRHSLHEVCRPVDRIDYPEPVRTVWVVQDFVKRCNTGLWSWGYALFTQETVSREGFCHCALKDLLYFAVHLGEQILRVSFRLDDICANLPADHLAAFLRCCDGDLDYFVQLGL
mmetsp:Transcript_17492/g.38117  ORF Transcript_17492/g.38117 Transcript_17492/m.38117 type:complete len:265 (-) Transcript_17492:357-1151(-)